MTTYDLAGSGTARSATAADRGGVPGRPVVVGIDAHKRTHTLVAVDPAGRQLGTTTVAATTQGHLTGLRWAQGRFDGELLWGVEDTRAMTARLERDLMDARQCVVRVPTALMARTRGTSREWGQVGSHRRARGSPGGTGSSGPPASPAQPLLP